MNQDKKTEKIEMLQSHEALLQKRREQALARRNNETSEQRRIRLQRNRQRAAESRRRGTENIVSRNVPKKQLPNDNSACKLLKNTRVLKAESPVNRRLNYNTAFILARTQKSWRIKTPDHLSPTGSIFLWDYAAGREKVRKFRVWYECVECELLIVSQTSERLFLFCSTFESETGLFVKPFVTENTVQFCTNCHFCLCAFLENSPRDKFLSWPSHSLMAGKYAKQF